MDIEEEEEEEDNDRKGEDVEEEDRSQDQEAHFVRACAIKIHLFMWKFTGKMPDRNPGTIVLREPA